MYVEKKKRLKTKCELMCSIVIIVYLIVMQYKCNLLPRKIYIYTFIFSYSNLFFAEGKRVLQLDDKFFTGYRKTALRPEEILLSIEIPYTKKVCFSTTHKGLINCRYA